MYSTYKKNNEKPKVVMFTYNTLKNKFDYI